jgi:flagellar motility protein MotE (MotC chaperone)
MQSRETEGREEGGGGRGGEDYWRERCAALQVEVTEWRSKAEEAEETEASYAEFMESSKALEQEMERDLQRSEKKNEEISRALSLLRLQHEDLLVHPPPSLLSPARLPAAALLSGSLAGGWPAWSGGW